MWATLEVWTFAAFWWTGGAQRGAVRSNAWRLKATDATPAAADDDDDAAPATACGDNGAAVIA